MKKHPILTLFLILALGVVACDSTATPAPDSSSIPTVSVINPDTASTNVCSAPQLIEYGDTVETSCSAPQAPFEFVAGDYLTSNGIEIWMKPGVKQDQFDVALAGGAVLALSDGPLPVGDIIAIFLIAGAYYALLANAQSGAYQMVPQVTLPQISFQSAQTVTAGQALETEAVIPPQPTWDWKVPEWQWESGEHAAMHRHWPVLFVMLVYLEVTAAPDSAYFGPASSRFVLTKDVSGWGTMILIFNTTSFVNGVIGGTNVPIPSVGNLITVFYFRTGKGGIERILNTTCASWQIYKVIGYFPQFEPPTLGGGGTCFENGNTGG